MVRFNATTYLEGHGWRGKGVPLDGEQGRGLKKPLALPQKRNVKGLGKERDRATEWWDSLFEAGAKKLQTPAPPKVASVASAAEAPMQRQTPSLMALAKREHARKQLMSGFVRGRPNKEYEDKVRELERVLAEQQQTAKESIESTPAQSESGLASPAAEEGAKLSKEERRAARHAKKQRKIESAQVSDAERPVKKESKKRRREDEATSIGMKTGKTKERKESAEESGPGATAPIEESDQVRTTKEKKKKKTAKVTRSSTEAVAETPSTDADARKTHKKRKE